VLAKPLAARTHLSSTVFQLFEPQVQKITVFKYRSPHFCFPWRRLCDYHAMCCMDGKTIQCLPTPCSMYPSIFNSFRVIRCLSRCVSPKIAIFTTVVFPLGTTLGQSRQMLYGWKENSMLTNCLAACAHLAITVSEIERDIGLKSSFLYPLAFDAPVRGVPVRIGPLRLV